MQRLLLVWVVCVSLVLGGCFGSGGGNGQGAGGNRQGDNQAPTISGSPPPVAIQGETYVFRPAVTDPDGDKLRFTIARKPDWAQFDSAAGRLSGNPDAGDVGSHLDITISVSDGRASATLQAFDVTVNQAAEGFVTLSWTPMENHDGSTLTDLAGYRIHVGRTADALTRVIILNNPGLTRYVVENLSPATWYFAMSSVNSHGQEIAKSTVVSKTLG